MRSSVMIRARWVPLHTVDLCVLVELLGLPLEISEKNLVIFLLIFHFLGHNFGDIPAADPGR